MTNTPVAPSFHGGPRPAAKKPVMLAVAGAGRRAAANHTSGAPVDPRRSAQAMRRESREAASPIQAPRSAEAFWREADPLIRSMWTMGVRVSVMAEKLDLSERSLRHRAYRLGLPPRVHGQIPWTKDETCELERMLGEGMGYAEIGRALGKTPGAVRSKCRMTGMLKTVVCRPQRERDRWQVLSDQKIAALYEAAGIRYDDDPRSGPDHRRFISQREVGGFGCAAAMCVSMTGARGQSVAPNGARRA